MIQLFPIFIVAVAGGLLLRRLHLPAAMLISGFLTIAVWSTFITDVSLPSLTRVFAQSMSGSFVGMSIRREDLKQLQSFCIPTVCLLAGYFIATLLLGLFVWLVSPLDLLTALLCVSPGGVGEMALVADAYGANAGAVTVLQVSRNVIGVCLFPAVIRLICREEKNGTAPRLLSQTAPPPCKTTIASFIIIIVLGTLGQISGIGAGAFLFALFGVSLIRLLGGITITLPSWLRQAGQLCAGFYIGSTFQSQDLSLLQHLALPAIIISCGYFLFSLLFGQILVSFFKKDRKEALLTSTAAGAADMAFIAADLGIESANLVAFQVFRWVFVSAVWPPILFWLYRIVA